MLQRHKWLVPNWGDSSDLEHFHYRRMLPWTVPSRPLEAERAPSLDTHAHAPFSAQVPLYSGTLHFTYEGNRPRQYKKHPSGSPHSLVTELGPRTWTLKLFPSLPPSGARPDRRGLACWVQVPGGDHLTRETASPPQWAHIPIIFPVL